MWEVLLDALLDSLKILPFLFAAYVLIELIEERTANKFEKNKLLKSRWAPLFSAGFGLIPQCGFSVLATDLFAKKLLSMGSLMAVYIATSDEAIPIMLSNPSAIPALLPLLLVKFLFAIAVGYGADLFIKRKSKGVAIHQNVEVRHIGCCGHDIDEDTISNVKKFFLHPLLHSLKIFGYILLVNAILGMIIHYVGEDNLIQFLSGSTLLQPLFASLVGLIPNCASSVIITQLYVVGGLTFGSCVAGLCVNAGIAFVVLFKQNKNKKENIIIITSLFVLSLALGLILSLFPIHFIK